MSGVYYMTIIPEKPSDTTEDAKASITKALSEFKTTFLVFRSSLSDHDAIATVVQLADNYTRWNQAEYRVIWIKDTSLINEWIKNHFGNNPKICAISLRWGTGEPREVVDQLQLSQIDTNIKIKNVFENAGQCD